MPALRVLLEPLQHGRAVEVRHHDVEQDEIDRLAPEERERFAPALGRPDVVTLPREPSREELTVLLVVVDHQDRRRRGRRDGSGRRALVLRPRAGVAGRPEPAGGRDGSRQAARHQRPQPGHRRRDALRVAAAALPSPRARRRSRSTAWPSRSSGAASAVARRPRSGGLSSIRTAASDSSTTASTARPSSAHLSSSPASSLPAGASSSSISL